MLTLIWFSISWEYPLRNKQGTESFSYAKFIFPGEKKERTQEGALRKEKHYSMAEPPVMIHVAMAATVKAPV